MDFTDSRISISSTPHLPSYCILYVIVIQETVDMAPTEIYSLLSPCLFSAVGHLPPSSLWTCPVIQLCGAGVLCFCVLVSVSAWLTTSSILATLCTTRGRFGWHFHCGPIALFKNLCCCRSHCTASSQNLVFTFQQEVCSERFFSKFVLNGWSVPTCSQINGEIALDP